MSHAAKMVAKQRAGFEEHARRAGLMPRPDDEFDTAEMRATVEVISAMERLEMVLNGVRPMTASAFTTPAGRSCTVIRHS